MLSRAATSLALLGRHLERSDHLARILGVHVAQSLDRRDEPDPEYWKRFMELAGWPHSDASRRGQAVEMVVGGTPGPSVRASIGAAPPLEIATRSGERSISAGTWKLDKAGSSATLTNRCLACPSAAMRALSGRERVAAITSHAPSSQSGSYAPAL